MKKTIKILALAIIYIFVVYYGLRTANGILNYFNYFQL